MIQPSNQLCYLEICFHGSLILNPKSKIYAVLITLGSQISFKFIYFSLPPLPHHNQINLAILILSNQCLVWILLFPSLISHIISLVFMLWSHWSSFRFLIFQSSSCVRTLAWAALYVLSIVDVSAMDRQKYCKFKNVIWLTV